MSLRISFTILQGHGIVRGSGSSRSPVFITATLRGSPEAPKVTREADGSDPVWNESFEFISQDPENDAIMFRLFKKEGGEPVALGKSQKLPVSGLRVGQPGVKQKIPFKGGDKSFGAASIEYQCIDTRPKIEYQIVDEASASSFSFSWGSYGPEYQLSLSGDLSYDGKLSDLKEDEVHKHPKASALVCRRLGGRKTLSGVVVGAVGIPVYDSLVTIQIGGRPDKVSSRQMAATANPAYNQPFDFGEVQRWEVVDFGIWCPDPRVAKLAEGSIPVKDIEIDADGEVDVRLVSPFALQGKNKSLGVLKVVFKHHFEPQ
jgi:hypothetical protein